MVANVVSIRRKECCDGHRGQLRRNMVLWWLRTTKVAFVATRLGLLKSVVMATWVD